MLKDRDRASCDSRPGLAILANAVAPYRVHLHHRLAAGIPELKLHSLFTHGKPLLDWQLDLPPAIHPAFFAQRDESLERRVSKPPVAEWRKAKSIIRYLQRQNVQIVVFHGYGYLSYLCVMDWCHRQRMPCLLRGDSNIRADCPRGLKAVMKRALLSYVRRRINATLPVGSLNEQYYTKYGFSRKNMFWVPFEPDYDTFSGVSDSEAETLLQQNGVPTGRHRVIYCGRLHPGKRIDLLIDAFAAISAQRANWDLVIVGEGSEGAALQARVPTQLKHRVHWLGFLDIADVSRAYHAADIMVLPSDLEAWALVVQEAMAAGLVVITSDMVGAAADLVVEGRTGYVFPHGDANALAERLRQATEPTQLHQMRQQVRPQLERFRAENDPVRGMREALSWAGVLSDASTDTPERCESPNDR